MSSRKAAQNTDFVQVLNHIPYDVIGSALPLIFSWIFKGKLKQYFGQKGFWTVFIIAGLFFLLCNHLIHKPKK